MNRYESMEKFKSYLIDNINSYFNTFNLKVECPHPYIDKSKCDILVYVEFEYNHDVRKFRIDRDRVYEEVIREELLTCDIYYLDEKSYCHILVRDIMSMIFGLIMGHNNDN